MTEHYSEHPIARLGPFDLISFVGKGAMGQVWRARHREQGVDAAIKVITEARAQREHYQRQFHQEVRAVAGLSHPGIVSVFDYGQISPEVEEATYGDLSAESPYLAMEYCPRGSLMDVDGQLGWRSIRSILLSLLDALAHAHSRGVFHRDIKPANVLIGDTNGWTGIKLSDFGLAFVSERTGEAGEFGNKGACGTPAYMSPEQLRGKWRDVGPWSDLYALGCLAYRLVCDRPPFGGRTIVEMARKHINEPSPPLQAKVAVPDDFEGWVRRLLQKNPLDRYRNAADAAWALLLMDQAPAAADGGELGDDISDLSFDSGEHTVVLKPFDDIINAHDTRPRSSPGHELPYVQRAMSGAYPDELALEPTQPPVPLEWHQLVGPRQPMKLLGAGRGLYGLRYIPVVGRNEERDALWQALRQVNQQRTPQAVVLRGAAGTGKSRLAQWLGERGHEAGAANLLTATHSPGPSAANGLARMLADYFRTAGLERAQILEHLEDRLRQRGVTQPTEWHALTEIISPATEADIAAGQMRVQIPQAVQRYRVIARVLSYLAEERPLVIWLDDVQWSADSLAFMRFCLSAEQTRHLPAVFVATVREEALAEAPLARQELDKLDQLRLDGRDQPEPLLQLDVDPLGEREQAEFIERLLYLEPTLARRLAERTHGNPLFAVQLVGDWVSRGVLEVTDAGFALRKDDPARIPEDLSAVWMSRLDEVLRDAPDQDLEAIELAAALGQTVDEAEWRACCALAGYGFPDESIELLLAHRLLEEDEQGYRFVHSMLRETLEKRARQADRWRAHHRACAEMVEHSQADPSALAERLGRHWLEARAFDKAIEPLFKAARQRGNAKDLPGTLRLLDLHEEALDGANIGEHSRERIQNQINRALALALMGRTEAQPLAERAAKQARRFDGPFAARILEKQAQVLSRFDDYDGSLAILEEALELVSDECDPELMVRIRLSLGTILITQRRLDEARQQLERALAMADDTNLVLASTILTELGRCDAKCHNYVEAEAQFERALKALDGSSFQRNRLSAVFQLAELARKRGSLDRAERLYRDISEQTKVVDPWQARIAQVNLAIIEVQRGHYQSPRSKLEALRDVYRRYGQPRVVASLQAGLLACLADAGEWTNYQRTLDDILEVTQSQHYYDFDLPLCADIATSICLERGQLDLAGQTATFAASQWEQLGEDERAIKARQQAESAG